MATKAPNFKAALFTVCQSLYASPIQVCYGHPGTYQAADVVHLGNIESRLDLATMSPLRRREEALQIEGRIRCYRGGGPEVAQAATERAYTLLSTLDTYLDDSGTIGSTQLTLGNVVRWALVSSHTLTEEEDPVILAKGRVSVLDFVVTAAVRV